MNNLSSKRFGNMKKYQPLVNQSGSDSSSLDNMIEVLNRWSKYWKSCKNANPSILAEYRLMDSDEKAFHEYNSMHMEAWMGCLNMLSR